MTSSYSYAHNISEQLLTAQDQLVESFLELASSYGVAPALSQLNGPGLYQWHVLFPRGGIDLFAHWQDLCDRRTVAAMTQDYSGSPRIRDKILWLIETRLNLMTPYRDVVQAMVRQHAWQLGLNAKLLWGTSSNFWYSAGDEATDFNYYTKRLLLMWVYASTASYWLAGHEAPAVRRFAEHRIDEVLRLGKFKKQLLNFFTKWAIHPEDYQIIL